MLHAVWGGGDLSGRQIDRRSRESCPFSAHHLVGAQDAHPELRGSLGDLDALLRC